MERNRDPQASDVAEIQATACAHLPTTGVAVLKVALPALSQANLADATQETDKPSSPNSV